MVQMVIMKEKHASEFGTAGAGYQAFGERCGKDEILKP
jgi:hypothetical protein